MVAQDFVVRFYEALITGKITVRKAFDIAATTVQPCMGDARFLLLPEGENNLQYKTVGALAVRAYTTLAEHLYQ